MFLAHAGLHFNPHLPEPVLYLAIGCAVVALVAIGVIRWLRRPSDSQTDLFKLTLTDDARFGHGKTVIVKAPKKK